MSNLVIIGDSFSFGNLNSNNKQCNSITWMELVSQNFKNHKLLLHAWPGRDVQTIIDAWIKLIPKLKEDDILVIGFPIIQRWRTPMDMDKWQTDDNGNIQLINRFTTDYTKFTDSDGNDYEVPIQVMHNHAAFRHNFIEIVKSLIELTPCHKYIWSWYDWMGPDVGHPKSDITKQIGWETHHDEYIKTNGVCGVKHDYHFSTDMHIKFSELVIESINISIKK